MYMKINNIHAALDFIVESDRGVSSFESMDIAKLVPSDKTRKHQQWYSTKGCHVRGGRLFWPPSISGGTSLGDMWSMVGSDFDSRPADMTSVNVGR